MSVKGGGLSKELEDALPCSAKLENNSPKNKNVKAGCFKDDFSVKDLELINIIFINVAYFNKN